ncbi:DUF6531 domain-containing protein [Streptomyces pacificus]|uniref:DUF6531 domain-containing protein n=1 Tax=Streptomyces pacificus TaxID=2705029 RepID=A0A6A0AZW4_9ACTN|nr:DUF6531 domain-containing protein [Streptomyces pacificus]GFH38510.1 hypothetical protein SCWH03_47520 [Streptomyces pacificus]
MRSAHAFLERLTDASLVGPGVPLVLERTYRSDSTAAGLLGRGWATPFDAKPTVVAGKATHRADDGASSVITQNGDGTCKAPAGSAAELVKGAIRRDACSDLGQGAGWTAKGATVHDHVIPLA